MGKSETTQTDATAPTTRRRMILFDRRVLTVGALVATLSVLALFWYLGTAWANGQALAAVLAVMALWLVVGSTVRHRFRFGLRTILVLMTVAAVLFAVVGKRWYEIQGRRAAIAALEPMGASVQYRYGVGEQGDWFRTRRGWHLPVWLVHVLGEDFYAEPYRLSIDGAQLDNEALADVDLAGFPHIAICWVNLNNEGAAVFRGLTDLDSLQMNDTAVTDDGLAHLSSCVNVTRLILGDNDISDVGLEHLADLTKLRSLNLNRTRVVGAGLAHLRGARSLFDLSLAGAPVTSEGLSQIKHFPALQYLDLDETKVADADLVHLADLTNLRHLSLINTKVGDDGMAHLVGLNNLEVLDLGGTRVDDDGLAHLANMKRLSGLGLYGTAVTDAGLIHLEGLNKLKRIDLENTGVTSAGVERLQQALPECDIQWTPPVAPVPTP